MAAELQANVTTDDSQTPGFLDEVAKEILVEAPTDSHRRPSPGDVVTARVASGENENEVIYTWTVGTLSAESSATDSEAFNPVIAGVDVDRLVRTMRRGERCSAKPKNTETPAALTVTLVSLERTENLTADGRLLRTTIREGTGWQIPTAGTELKVRFSWRTVAVGRLPVSNAGEVIPACVVSLVGLSAAEAAESKELEDLRRELSQGLNGSPPIIIKIDGATSSATAPQIQRVSHGAKVLLDSPDGISTAEALTRMQEALCMPPNPARSITQEVSMRVEAHKNGSANNGKLDIFCTAEDWLPAAIGPVALHDLHAGQRCLVRVQPELAFGVVGLPKFGIMPNSALEYEIELLQIMAFEDVSLDKSKSVMKKVIKEGEGYERPTEGRQVTVSVEARDESTGTVLLEQQKLEFNVACGNYCSALDETLLTMKKGETCEVRCSNPSLCTDTGLGLDPSAASAMVLCLELQDFEKVNLYSAEEAERLQHCVGRKDAGAKFAKIGDWLRALRRYQNVVTTLSYLEHWKDEKAKNEAIVIRRACNLNIALGQLKRESWSEAEKACSAVLREEPENVKALFRRGHALKELGEYRDAEQSLRKALDQDKDNKDAAKMLRDIRQFVKEEVAQQKKMFSKMLASDKAPTEDVVGAERASAKPTPRKNSSRGSAATSEDDEDALENSCYYIMGASVLLAALAAGIYLSNGRWRDRGL